MEDSLGVLNINNATLRVGKLQVSDIQGVDTALNVTKSNSVLVYDDQHTATTFNGILGGSATRDTTNNYLNLTQGSVYWGIKLPNAWVMEFHINIRSGTNAGPLLVNTYSTTFTGAQGYSFIFDDSGDKITIKYGSTQLASQVVSGLFTSSDQFQKVTIHYERGRINISLDGVHKLYFTDVERSIPYTTGEYINMSSTSADVRQVKNLKITNSDKWTYSGHSNVVFTQGSVGIGLADPSEKLHVAGTIKAVDFKGDGTTLSGVAKNTDITTIRSEMAANTLTLRNDLQSNVGIIRSEMAANTVAMQSNLNDNSSRITALESTTMSIGGVKTFTNDVIIESNLAVHGNVLVANTQHLIVSDPIIELGANNQNANDLGIVMSRHNHGTNDSNVAIIYDESAKELTFGYTLKNANSHIIPIQASDILTTNICGSLRTTSNLIVDTDTIYVDATNDRVGINKTPTTALDVSGVATFDNDLIVDTDTLHVDVSSGRVGINKLTPDANLHVVGNTYVSSNLIVDSNISCTNLHASNLTMNLVTMMGTQTFEQVVNNGRVLNSNVLIISNATPSTSSTTGALTLTAGGLGVEGNVHVGTAGQIVVSNAAQSTSSSTGAVQIAGGLGVAGNVHVGSNIHVGTFPLSTVTSNLVMCDTATGQLLDSALERGFMEHPVTPMTGYITRSDLGTYEASASSNDTTNSYNTWKAFDNDTSTRWGLGHALAYNTTTGVWDGATSNPDITTMDVGGTRYAGHWLQLKVPNSIVLSHSNIYPLTGVAARAPVDGVILGSNDGENWYKLTEFSGLSNSDNTWTRIDVNARTPYQYFRMCVTKIGTGHNILNFTEWKLFAEKPVTKLENVHISGDLSSETIQTGYIKWPRKSLKANNSEGYVASASNVYGSTFDAYYAFDDTATIDGVHPGTAHAWITPANSFDTTNGTVVSSSAATFDGLDCHWIQLQSPQAFAVSHFDFDRRESESYSTIIPQETPKEGYLYASNDGFDWTRINSFSDLPKLGPQDWHRIDVKNSTPYTHYRLVVTKIHPSNTQGYLGISNLRFFEAATGVGATPTSAKLQVHGSLGLAKGSSLFAGDSIVMETAKHDRPLTDYPEVAMTASTVGGYTVSEPTNTFHGNSSFRLWTAFNNDTSTPDWETMGGCYDTGTRDPQTSGSYVVTTVASGTTYYGVYAQMLAPIRVKVSHVDIRPQNTYGLERLPGIAVFVGSDDGTTWTLIRSVTNNSGKLNTYTRYNVNATQAYKYIRIIWNKLTSAGSTTSFRDRAAASEIKIYGTEEGDESVDVVHRSVPNKPGTQQNIVLWDPNDPASFSLADSSNVYDLSGTGNTGILGPANNAAKPTLYSSPEGWNAWSFSGNNDCTIETEYGSAVGLTGIHSLSLWFWRDPVNNLGAQLTLASLKDNTSGAVDSTPHFTVDAAGKIGYKFWSNDLTGQIMTPRGQWVHVAFTYDGGALRESRKIYINTVLDDLGTGGGVNALTLPANSRFILGGYPSRNSCWDGYIAGVRLYSKVLSHEQVLELFDEGAERFGLREDLVSVHRGNLGIGLRDPEQRLVVKPQTDAGHFPQTEITHTGDFAYLHDNNSNARTFNVWTEKDGLLRVGCSTFFAGGNSNPLYPFQVFNTTGYRWQDSGAKYSTNTGNYTGSSSTTVDGTSRSGEYIEIVFGQPIQVEKFIMNVNLGGNFQNRGARTGVIAAKNYEDDSFTAVYELSGHAWNTNQDYEFVPSSSAPYRHYRFVIETLQGGTASDTTALTKWQFYGKYASTCNGAVLKTGGVVTGGVIAEAVSLGGKSSEAPLTVGKPAGGGAAMTSAASHWITNTGINSTTQRVVTEAHSGISIYALGNILTRQYLVSASGTLQSSDRRIKTNIADVNDSSALEAFRLIKPKLYNYTDVTRGSLPVWGFIAQEVGEVLNHSTQTRTEYIPNVYELANVFAEGTVLEFDTTKLQPGASELRLYDAGGAEQDALIDEIVDEFTVRMSKPVDSRDRVFVFGQRVNDFTLLKKDAIWTTAAAALQQVDRELQAEKAKTKALESKLAGERVPLENAEGLAIDANHAPCVKPNDPLFLGIVGADGRVAAKGKRAKVWVTNIGAPLSAGDIIATTSNVAGYCTKLTDLTEVHRAVGKVLVDVALPQVTDHNFVAPAVPRRRKVTETSNVTVWVREFKSTAEQYATLAEDERRVRDEVYYVRDDFVEVVNNEFVRKMPAFDVECYHRTQIETCDAEIYEALPDSEKFKYVLGEDGVYTYTHVNMLTIDAWMGLEEDERDSFVHGYFKKVTEEMSEDEWTALEDSVVQAKFEKRTRPVYFRLIVARESRGGYTEEVRAETVDVLDAFGRPTYEDVEGETDPAFEFRYLTTEGDISDRHSGVYMAALVECLLF